MDNRGMPVVALLTDFGTSDYFVAAMKGRILSIAPSAQIVDITHDVPPQDVRAAAFILRSCYRDFPADTVFVCVVDPGVGSARRALAVEFDGRKFVAPDNGLLTFILKRGGAAIRHLNNTELFAPSISSTFHGRDVFAPAAAHLALGVAIEDAGPAVDGPALLAEPEPSISDDGRVIGQVIHIDRFGNLVTNLLPALLTDGSELRVSGRTISRFVDHYAEADPLEVIGITGSAGLIEISSNMGSAADLLGARVGDEVVLTGGKVAE
ncbi:MAG: S-adenosyl-l-methionine hydroxide adenosyltransferase family protein [Pyrinomonadaceae bacterium]